MAEDGRSHEDSAVSPTGDRSRATHDRKPTRALLDFMATGWDTSGADPGTPIEGVENYQRRREDLSQRFPGMLIVVPAGVEKMRANDTEYRFRPSTDYLYLVGAGQPDEVLVMEPQAEGGHRARILTEPSPDYTKSGFFTDRGKGSLWVGPSRGLEATESQLGLGAGAISELPQTLTAYDHGVVLRGVDPKVDQLAADLAGPDEELSHQLSEMRLVKDPLEVKLVEEACDLTRQGFEDVVRALPTARTERDVEVAFFARARVAGNDTGYSTIAAAGSHATILHWSRNSGAVRPGDLLLLDAGVESNRYYTADVTRTLPISGRFSTVQRKVYQLVYQAQLAAFAEVRPSNEFLAPNRAAQKVLAIGLAEMGLLPVSAEESLAPDSQLHQRYTLHRVSHMLGLDVHDCAQAREQTYIKALLEPGMVLTVEPGLYFQPNDLTVPEELRGIGVRIEDDVLVTEGGYRLLSVGIPSQPDEIERWMADLWAGSGS
ncbi:MAG TPA: aminopeptidase P family protein [Candidatus Dormibacteraeota bacterium]|nr:aminopeptidase P family protein [Candidatus Dormibacteraeota bacterium]